MSRLKSWAVLICASILLSFLSGPPAGAQLTPPSDNHLYVARLYQDLLNRPIDPFGNQVATEMNQGLHTRRQVADLFLGSPDNLRRTVSSYYQQFLGRDPAPADLNFWLNQLVINPNYDPVRSGILGSTEYFSTNGGNNTAFVQSLYQDLLNRPADPAGLSNFVNLLQGGTPRQQVADTILNTTESHQRIVRDYYQQFLRRPADPAGLDTFTQLLNLNIPEPVILGEILSSNEYFQNALPEPATALALIPLCAIVTARGRRPRRPAA